MNKELPCYVISDLLPLYQDDVISEQTKRDVEMHISQCTKCKNDLDNMNIQISIRSASSDIKNNPLKKIKAYQRIQGILGGIIAFFLGMCLPVVRVMITIIGYNEIPDYYLARLKVAWHTGLLKMCISGAIVCAIYLFITFIIKKIVSKSKYQIQK